MKEFSEKQHQNQFRVVISEYILEFGRSWVKARGRILRERLQTPLKDGLSDRGIIAALVKRATPFIWIGARNA